MPLRTAKAEWLGKLNDGRGNMHFDAYDGPFTFTSRFEEGEGTNPEELIGAAHAGCFSMQFSGVLGKNGFAPESIRTTARVHIDKDENGFTITAIDLATDARVPGIDNATFLRLADEAKATCPVSRALAAVPIHLDARLEQKAA